MSQDAQMLISFASISIAILGLAVSAFAYLNARQARIHNQETTEFKLKLDALIAANELAASWQDILSELYRFRQRLKSNVDCDTEAAHNVLKELDGWHEEFKSSHSLAADIAKRCDENFDTWSVENAAIALRLCLTTKPKMEQSRDELRRRLPMLEATLSNIAPSQADLSTI